VGVVRVVAAAAAVVIVVVVVVVVVITSIIIVRKSLGVDRGDAALRDARQQALDSVALLSFAAPGLPLLAAQLQRV
jgi:hypothetical protein